MFDTSVDLPAFDGVTERFFHWPPLFVLLLLLQEKELRKKHQEEEDRMHTEVSVFCRDYGLPDTVADIFYKKKFRYLDDAFFELNVSLLSLSLSSLASLFLCVSVFLSVSLPSLLPLHRISIVDQTSLCMSQLTFEAALKHSRPLFQVSLLFLY